MKRHEIKYRDSIGNLLTFEKFLILNGFRKHFPCREICSLYFETNNLLFYINAEEGITPRKKVRIRTYNANFSGPDFYLEEKRTLHSYKTKTSKKISLQQLNQYISGGLLDKSFGLLTPNVFVTYNRLYFYNQVLNIRVTLDFDLRSRQRYTETHFKEPDFYIIEVKTDAIQPIEVVHNIFGISNLRFSKYCEAVKRLGVLK